MKSLAPLLSIIALVVGLVGCPGGGGDGGGGGSSSTAFLYVSNFGGSDISAYSVDTTTGALAPLAGSPFPAEADPQAMTLNASGSVAFVSNAGSASVSGYLLNAGTGLLTPASVIAFPAGTIPQTLTLEPFEKFAFVANAGAHTVSVYSVNPTTGVLTAVAGSPFLVAPGTQPQRATVVTVSPTVQFVYLANAGSNDVSGFFLNTSTGFLNPAPGSPFAVGATPQSVVADSAGNFVYVSNAGAASISVFGVNQT
ncbi:MAG: beta-propeller fold lactonase family protein, partial [Nitrospirota bacterium]